MTRGGRRKNRDGPARRCIALGESGPADRLIRFVLAPDGAIVPDVAGRLPGRGAWLTADRALVGHAVKKKLFSRAFRTQVRVPDDLADMLEGLLVRRLQDIVGLARKAGAAVTGAEKVRARIVSGTAAVLLQARDGARDGCAKLATLAKAAGNGRIHRIGLLDSPELGLAFGREFAIHAALDAGGFAGRARAEAQRLGGFRDDPLPDGAATDRPGHGGDRPDLEYQRVEDSEGPAGGTLEQDDR